MMIAMAKRRLLPALHMCRHTLPVQRGHLVVAEIFCWVTLSVWVKILSDMDHLVFYQVERQDDIYPGKGKAGNAGRDEQGLKIMSLNFGRS